MITKLLFFIVTTTILIGIAIAEPTLSRGQVMKLRDVILKAENERYSGLLIVEPVYSEKDRLWNINSIGEIDGPFYTMQIREKDGYYRLGWVSPRGSSGAASERFRMSPNIKRKVVELLEEFKQEKKS